MSNKYMTEENRPKHLRNIFLLGEFYPIVRSSIICGFCHSKLHRGYVSDKLLDEHQCIQKNCKHFEKFSDWPYWTNRTKISNIKKKKKCIKKLKDDYLESLKELAQETIDELNYPLLITSICECESTLNIYYVSDNFDNQIKYTAFIQKFSKMVEQNITLIRVKHPNGSMATISDYLNAKNN